MLEALETLTTRAAMAADRGYASTPPLRWHPQPARMRPTEPPMAGILWGEFDAVNHVFRKKPAPTKGFADIP